MNFIFLIGLFLSFFNLYGDEIKVPVVHGPTIYIEKTPPQPQKIPRSTGPILLDARPSFDFAMGHLPQAMNIRSEDYSQTEAAHKGALDPDLDLLSRKLSYLGISPKRDVIVMGGGLKGHGEEGRIGWMLNYLGIKKVRVTSFDEVPGKRVVDKFFENPSSGPWNPDPQFGLRIKRSEVEKISKDKSAAIIDVRSADDFKKGHIPTAINILWTEFLNKSGNPADAYAVGKLLKDHHIPQDQTLVFYSADGISSGYAAFVAHNTGFHCRHYDASFNEWQSDPHAEIEK
jgi:thiosulfate/3-mercaptopyruvate sulfurtransferase